MNETLVDNNKIVAVKQILSALQRSEWYTAEVMQSKQYTRLSQIVEHTYQTVPFYKAILDDARYQPGQVLTASFLESLPIISRKQLQSGQESTLRSTALQPNDYQYSIVTSGSTGIAVRLIGTLDTACYWQALSMRDHLWHQRDFSKTLAAIRWAKRSYANPPLGEPSDHWGAVTEGLVETGASFFLNVMSATQDQLTWLQMINPYYLITYPSQVKVLLQHLIDQKIDLTHLHEIRTLGETIDTELLALSAQYGVKLTDIYSSEEFGIIALQCPEYGNYHVQSENLILEVVDVHGKHCTPGEEGRLVITSLHNFATPLLRYAIGDYAQTAPPCPCGRDALPTLKKISGRQRNRLVFPTGESRFPYLGDREERRTITTAVKKFQLIQHTPRKLEYKIVAETPLTPDQEKRYLALMKKDLGYPFDITITYHEDIPRQPNGKFEEFISYV